MTWTTTRNPAEFAAAADDFLCARPVENSVLITVAANLRRRGLDAYGPQPPLFGWWRPPGAGGSVAAAFLRTPPHHLLLARGALPAARELAADWDTEQGGELPGVRGDRETAEAFGAAWQERTAAPVELERAIRLYRLAQLAPRTAPPGRARVARPADRELLIAWQRAFATDIGELPIDDTRAVDDAIALGGRTLWETPDGEPVAMAGKTAHAAGTATRVVAVYTPPAHRGRGYAGGVTAAVSQGALDAGASEVLLFTDLANPVSNALYQHLGYVPVRDHVSLLFTAAAGRA